MALVQVLLQITSLSLLDGCCLLDSAAFKINIKECQLLAEVSNGIRELCLPLLLAQPRSEGLWCQHTRPGRSLSPVGESVSAASLEPWEACDRSCPGDVCCPITALAGGCFQACRLQYHRYCVMPQNHSGCGIAFFKQLAGTSGGWCPS